jgi:predicted 3-demethylubiquinone-9 3-methyltransferase (glyoxalase superfamily)
MEGEEDCLSQQITPCLWFDHNAEEAVNYYVSRFPNSQVDSILRSGDDDSAPAIFISFRLNGQPFQAINGGPEFSFTEAISFSVDCANQQEIDYYWDTLIGDGGKPIECGWLKDKYGLSWQIVPRQFIEMMQSPDRRRADQAMQRMLQMTKLDIAELQKAYDAD